MLSLREERGKQYKIVTKENRQFYLAECDAAGRKKIIIIIIIARDGLKNLHNNITNRYIVLGSMFEHHY